MQRRNFIKISGTTLASLLIADFIKAQNKKVHLIQVPAVVKILSGNEYYTLQSSDNILWKYKDVVVELKIVEDKTAVFVQSPSLALKEIKLSWNYNTSSTAKILGDHWERTYGDVGWKNLDTVSKSPWYLIQNDGEYTNCFGVKTGCNSICYWQLTKENISLTLDTKNGGNGVMLGARKLHAADIVTTKNEADENVYATARRFCKVMCDKPRLPAQPVYGINDWYFAYGNNSAELILQHTSLMAAFVTNNSNKPFSVIDAGWAIKSPLIPDDCCWGDNFANSNSKFGDMSKLANDIKKLGMRPGLWVRPLCASHDDKPTILMPKIKGRNDDTNPILDPSIPENIERVKNYMHTYRQWNFEMVKHDYTSYDIFGKWGFEMIDDITEPNWQMADNTKTNAEIILQLFNAIREAAGNMYVIGCNTISHLSAGIFELNRIGDDTSGREWERTRKMGVNTLGFRMMQHKNFYEADGDCVGLTNEVPWSKNKQWMQLLAQSSTPLFISAQPNAVGAQQKQIIKESFAQASKVQPIAEPLDWLTTTLPSQWKLDGEIKNFDWS